MLINSARYNSFMINEMRNNKDKVEFLLENSQPVRDCDKLLWLAYLDTFHDLSQEIGVDAYLKLMSLIMAESTPTMESIRRVRQKFQENGEYLGVKRKIRKQAEGEVREGIKDLLEG